MSACSHTECLRGSSLEVEVRVASTFNPPLCPFVRRCKAVNASVTPQWSGARVLSFCPCAHCFVSVPLGFMGRCVYCVNSSVVVSAAWAFCFRCLLSRKYFSMTPVPPDDEAHHQRRPQQRPGLLQRKVSEHFDQKPQAHYDDEGPKEVECKFQHKI